MAVLPEDFDVEDEREWRGVPLALAATGAGAGSDEAGAVMTGTWSVAARWSSSGGAGEGGVAGAFGAPAAGDCDGVFLGFSRALRGQKKSSVSRNVAAEAATTQ